MGPSPRGPLSTSTLTTWTVPTKAAGPSGWVLLLNPYKVLTRIEVCDHGGLAVCLLVQGSSQGLFTRDPQMMFGDPTRVSARNRMYHEQKPCCHLKLI